MENPTLIFRHEYNKYRRDFNYVEQYVDQVVKYATIKDRSIDPVKYREFVKQSISKDGKYPLFNPRMRVNMKDENNDRYYTETNMLQYLKTIEKRKLKFAPTFTTYMDESQQLSLESEFLVEGQAMRKAEKKLKFLAKEAGDDEGVEYHDNLQLMYKIQNNSSSGAKAAKGTIQFNQTGHSTLTSICRSETSFANSTNEKFLGGYRHYFNPEVTINNILVTLTYCDLEETKRVMDMYNLHYVTPSELLEVIKRSTELYWHAPSEFKKIENFVNDLTPLECSTYLYNSDLYHLRIFNEELVRNLFKRLIDVDNLEPLSAAEADKYISVMDGDLAALIVVYAAGMCEGKSVFTALSENSEIVPKVGAIIKNTVDVLLEFKDLIRCFWVTDIMPFETAHVPGMMRGVVLGSDTDSSLFSMDVYWVKWYCGEVIHNEESTRVEATAVFLTTMHIAHILGLMTGVLGVIDEKKPLIAMKNEFMFSSFTTTSAGKHYFAKKEAQEGILINKDKMEVEIKGVRLKHTKVPKHITKMFQQQLFDVMNNIEKDEKMSLRELVRKGALIEKEVYDDIIKGNGNYLQRSQIKSKDAYQVENSAYKRGYLMWEEVFADKYGHTVEPPYDAVKIATTVDTKAKFESWIASMEDKTIATRLKNWVDINNDGKPLATFQIPQAIVRSSGIPKEFLPVMELRKLAFTITSPYYLLLESFGYFVQNKKLTRLFSDEFEDTLIPESIFEGSEVD